jgi:hypothetical protein
MDDLERSLTDLLADGSRQVARETPLRRARAWLRRETAGGGP